MYKNHHRIVSYINHQQIASYINPHIDLLMNFIKICLFHESAPNRSSRPLNTQLLLEILIRIQWKTFQHPKNRKKIIKIPHSYPLKGAVMYYDTTRKSATITSRYTICFETYRFLQSKHKIYTAYPFLLRARY